MAWIDHRTERKSVVGKDIKPGHLVAFNNLPDAAWFEVLDVEGFSLTLREFGTLNVSQTMDRSLVARHKA